MHQPDLIYTTFRDQVLAEIGSNHQRLKKDVKLVGNLAAKGHAYSKELMVVGRAGNGGWEDGKLPVEFADTQGRDAFTQQIWQRLNNPGVCPLDWVTNGEWKTAKAKGKDYYNPNRSPFWRVIKSTLQKLNITQSPPINWASHIVWSNLYKVAPENGGNPSPTAQNHQLNGCVELFKLELDFYQPKRLLLMTGWEYWASPFFRNLSAKMAPARDMKYVEQSGIISLSAGIPCACVVACRPEARPEKEWTDEVVWAFNACK